MMHEQHQQLTIWDELDPDGLEPRALIKPSGWDRHWAQQIDPDAITDAEVATIIYPRTRPPEVTAAVGNG